MTKRCPFYRRIDEGGDIADPRFLGRGREIRNEPVGLRQGSVDASKKLNY
jgi:hypothetical protein